MTDKPIKLDDLYKKYPFIYEIDGDFYFIGFGICKPCNSSTAIEFYESYLASLKEIGEDNIANRLCDIDDNRIEALLFYFRKIKAYSDIEVNPKDITSFRETIDEMVNSLTDEQ